MLDAIKDMPAALRSGVLARHDVRSAQALNESLAAQRANRAEAARGLIDYPHPV